MDKRAFKNFITKRSSIWTISLCMTGIIVLGGVAAVNQTRQKRDAQNETEFDQVAYLEEELDASDDIEDALFPTLENKLTDDMAQASANKAVEDREADSASDKTQTDSADSKQTAQNTAEDGVLDEAQAVSADGQSDGNQTSLADSQANETQTASADGQMEDVQAVSGNGEMAGMQNASVDGEPANAGEAAAEVSSGQIISEEALIAEGISFTEENSLMWPAAGTILLDYSMDGSIYFPTLNQYKYNPALVIGSDTGNQVLAAAKGIVESVSVDEETGNTLVLNIGGGYKLTYGQLKEVAVVQGEVVSEGALLGYVSEPTKYYSQEGSNLYFAMTQNDLPVDPVLYLE